MIRDFRVADFLTLGNGCAGMGSIFAAMTYAVSLDPQALKLAFALFPVAFVCDVLDGRVARMRGEVSMLGQELDSLADLVSFGVAPSVLAFALGMRGGLDAAALVFFVGCGISRLARYNATAAHLADDTGKVKYFEGTPIPTSLGVVAVLGALAWSGRVHERLPFGALDLGGITLHPLIFLYVASGTAMISKTLRIPKP